MIVFSVFVLLAWEYNYIPSVLLFLCYYLYFSSEGLCLIYLSDELRYA